MKFHCVSLIFTPLALVVFACSGDKDPDPIQADFAESRTTFDTLAGAEDNSYSYERFDQSWVGFADRTKIVVEQDVVVERENTSWSDFPGGVVEGSYIEQGADVGMNADGFPAKTIPELYEQCENEVLTKDPATNDITLSFHPDGVLAVCTYYPHGCQDDCTSGIRIENLQFGP